MFVLKRCQYSRHSMGNQTHVEDDATIWTGDVEHVEGSNNQNQLEVEPGVPDIQNQELNVCCGCEHNSVCRRNQTCRCLHIYCQSTCGCTRSWREMWELPINRPDDRGAFIILPVVSFLFVIIVGTILSANDSSFREEHNLNRWLVVALAYLIPVLFVFLCLIVSYYLVCVRSGSCTRRFQESSCPFLWGPLLLIWAMATTPIGYLFLWAVSRDEFRSKLDDDQPTIFFSAFFGILLSASFVGILFLIRNCLRVWCQSCCDARSMAASAIVAGEGANVLINT